MIEKFNIAVFEYINHFVGINPILDNLAKVTAEYLPFIFVFWLLYLWLKRDNKHKDVALYSTYSVILGLLVNSLIAVFYFHPRPFMVPIGKLLIQHRPSASFPSDHTTFMLSIAFTLSYFKETKIAGMVLLVLGLVGGIARVFCGVHFPIDIIGSFIVSLAVSFVIYSLRYKIEGLNQFIINIYLKTFRR